MDDNIPTYITGRLTLYLQKKIDKICRQADFSTYSIANNAITSLHFLKSR